MNVEYKCKRNYVRTSVEHSVNRTQIDSDQKQDRFARQHDKRSVQCPVQQRLDSPILPFRLGIERGIGRRGFAEALSLVE